MPDDALRPTAALYEQDFALWAEAQARALKEGRARDLDWDNLAEEIESLVRAQKNELSSRLRVLTQHLLKWEHQPALRCRSWLTTIGGQRADLELLFEDSPGLRPLAPARLPGAYAQARRLAAAETGLAPGAFPAECPYALADVLCLDFMPGAPWSPDVLIRD